MPPDALGIEAQQQEQEGTSLDYLGVRSPTAFSGRPALPSAAGPPGTGGPAPPTISGAGTAPAGPRRALESGPLESNTFADLAATVGGDPSAGEGAAGAPGFSEVGQMPGSFGFGVGSPVGIGIGPTGSVGVGVNTGNQSVDSVLNAALGLAFGQAGIPSSVNIPGLIAMLTQSPVMGMLSTAIGAIGAPLTMVQLAHAFAKNSPNSTTALIDTVQQAINDPDPSVAESAATAQNEAQQAAAAAAAGQSFSFSTAEAAAMAAAMGVPGISSFSGAPGGYAIGQQSNVGAHTAPPAAFNTFAELAAAMGFGRGRGLDEPGPMSAAGQGEGEGPGPGTDDGTGGGQTGDAPGVGGGAPF